MTQRAAEGSREIDMIRGLPETERAIEVGLSLQGIYDCLREYGSAHVRLQRSCGGRDDWLFPLLEEADELASLYPASSAVRRVREKISDVGRKIREGVDYGVIDGRTLES